MFSSYSEKICRVATPKKDQTHRTQPFSCDMCDDGNWLSETDVEVHKKDSHFTAIHQQMDEHKDRFCMICMKLQKSRTDLVEHIKSRHLYSSPTAQRIEREIFICHYCSRIFFNKEVLSIHMLNAHVFKNKKNATTPFTCPICKHTIKLKTMWFHFHLHEIPSVTCCDICLTSFSNCEDLMKHVAKKHPRYYFCNMCNYETTKEAYFNAHLDMHSQMPIEGVKGFTNPDIMFTIICTLPCAKVNRYKYNIHNALKGLDLPRFMYVCIICREICLSKQKAHTHVLRDHLSPIIQPMRRAQHACACGQEFFNKVLLKHHVFKEKGMHRDLRDNELPSPELFQNPTHNTTVRTFNLTNKQTDKRSQSNEVVILSDEVILPRQESHEDPEIISNDEIIIDSIEESTDVNDEVTLIRNDPKLPRNKRKNIQSNDKTIVYQNDQIMMIRNYAEIHKNKRKIVECNDNIMDQNDEVIIMGDNIEIRRNERKNIESNYDTMDLNDQVTMMNDVEIQRKKPRAIDSSNNKDISDINDEIVDTNNKDIDENDEIIDLDNAEVIDLNIHNDTDDQNDSSVQYVIVTQEDEMQGDVAYLYAQINDENMSISVEDISTEEVIGV